MGSKPWVFSNLDGRLNERGDKIQPWCTPSVIIKIFRSHNISFDTAFQLGIHVSNKVENSSTYSIIE